VAERTVIDLVFTRNGCRKTITRYTAKKGYCPRCDQYYLPPSLDRLCKYQFGHGFQAWTVYQRVVLRLPYRIITQVMEHLFGVGLSSGTVMRFLKYLADYYAPTEAAILQAILKSDFVHVDETKISIQGVDHYVWVFTDGKHVLFRMTESREADIVREVLAGYQGVLVSDFYPGYDSMPCRQQKCLVHLIRDINDDLWKAPFDRELEAFAVEVQALLVPILEAVNRYGLKAWHLRKFDRDVERFYQECDGKGVSVRGSRDLPQAVRPLPGEPLHLPGPGRHPVEQQHGRAGDSAAGGAEEDLRPVLQASRPAVPPVTGHLADVPLSGEVVSQVPVVEGDRRGLIPAGEANPVFDTGGPGVRRSAGCEPRRGRARRNVRSGWRTPDGAGRQRRRG